MTSESENNLIMNNLNFSIFDWVPGPLLKSLVPLISVKDHKRIRISKGSKKRTNSTNPYCVIIIIEQG